MNIYQLMPLHIMRYYSVLSLLMLFDGILGYTILKLLIQYCDFLYIVCIYIHALSITCLLCCIYMFLHCHIKKSYAIFVYGNARPIMCEVHVCTCSLCVCVHCLFHVTGSILHTHIFVPILCYVAMVKCICYRESTQSIESNM